MSPTKGLPLNQAAQGALIDDLDVEVSDAVFCEWDYNGNIDHAVMALGVTYTDQHGKTYDQYYSAGELSFLVPNEDGSGFIPASDSTKTMLSDSCNAWKFIQSLMECGFPEEILAEGNIKALTGLKCHVKQVAQPKRQGLIRGGKNPERDPTVLLVTAIHELPGAAPAPKKGIAGKGQPVGAGARPTPGPVPAQAAKPGLGKPALTKAAPAATTAARTAAKPATSPSKANGRAGASTTTAGDDEREMAAEILNGILAEAGGVVAKKDLSKLAFAAAGAKVTAGELDAKAKQKIVQLIYMDSFLHELAQGGAITYDGATVAWV